jgi:hypothetical protein
MQEDLEVNEEVPSEILGIIFCEFDNDEGPKIIYQVKLRHLSWQNSMGLNNILPRNHQN